MKPDTEIWTEVRKYRNVLIHSEVLWDKYNVFQTPVQHSIMCKYMTNNRQCWISVALMAMNIKQIAVL
jgi:hypothetical protein